jgi:L-2-hydroxyglutarate oxidase LhgO
METIGVDTVVIGGGVIGLAIARSIALTGRHVTVLESENRCGTHTSSRNSEVIHAGIYYPADSLKARLCVAGKHLLYAYAGAERVAHHRVGKIIVATREDEVPVLERLVGQAARNGVTDLEWLSEAEVKDLEPSIIAVRGLLSPSTGIIDSHAFMIALRRDAENAGADIVVASPVLGGEVTAEGLELSVGGSEPVRLSCGAVVNAAGLRAQDVARSISGVPRESVPPQYFAKGHYFVLRGASPFRRLVYPVPVPGGLGVHVTLDMGGQARFGPDVSWLDDVDYSFDVDREKAFYAAIRHYFPGLADDTLSPGYTGVRPKLSPAGAPAADFVVQGPAEHGVAGLVNLYGIESPGLTAALALAEMVLPMLDARAG